MARVLVFPGTASCEFCGRPLNFKSRRREQDFAIGECETFDCQMNDKELKILGTWIEVEVLEDNH